MKLELLDSIVGTSDSALGIIATLSTAAFALYKYRKSRRFNRITYYVARGVFTDRSESLDCLNKAIRNNSNLINVYGKRGIGKSSFLRFFCDFVNCTLKKRNEKTMLKGTKKPRGRAFYIEVSGSGSKSLEEQIVGNMSSYGSSLSEIANQTSKMFRFYKRIFIVIDNINNAAMSRELEAIIDVFLSHSDKYYIIIGSVEKQPLLNAINNERIEHIELMVFGDDDIFEFANENGKSIPTEYISRIIDFSEGLPVFVSLLLSNKSTDLFSIKYDNDRMDKYMERIINDLEYNDARLALYIGLLSITNAVIPIQLIRTFCKSLSVQNIETLENSSLIEYDREKQTVKMHELFRNYFYRGFCNSPDIANEIYEYYANNGKLFEQSYFLVMKQADDSNNVILSAVNKAINNSNFSYLLMLGEHYKRLYGWQSSDYLSPNTFLTLVYGYLEGLIGIGDYPAAKEVIEKCKISARNPSSEIQFRFSLLTAQLYHLMNCYQEAIATYDILLNCIKEDDQFLKYEPKCYWGIAHSYRHEGYDYDRAICYYDKAIKSATSLKQESEIIKSMREKLLIMMLRDKKKQASKLYSKIDEHMNRLPEDSYYATKISYLKCKAIYIRTMCGGDGQRELELLESSLEEYKTQKKRLQYNTLFELGEYYRRQEKFTLAAENYNMALTFSRRNKDHNLETMAIIAIVVNEVCSDKCLKSILDEKIDAVVQALDDSAEYNLFTNKLLLEIILAYLQGEQIDGETVNNIKRLSYTSALYICEASSKEAFRKLNLFLM